MKPVRKKKWKHFCRGNNSPVTRVLAQCDVWYCFKGIFFILIYSWKKSFQIESVHFLSTNLLESQYNNVFSENSPKNINCVYSNELSPTDLVHELEYVWSFLLLFWSNVGSDAPKHLWTRSVTWPKLQVESTAACQAHWLRARLKSVLMCWSEWWNSLLSAGQSFSVIPLSLASKQYLDFESFLISYGKFFPFGTLLRIPFCQPRGTRARVVRMSIWAGG